MKICTRVLLIQEVRMLFKVIVYFSFHSSLKEKHRFSSIAPSPSNWPTSKSAIPAFDLKMTSWIESTKTIDMILLTEDYSQFQLGFLSSVPRVLKPLRQKGLSVRNLLFSAFFNKFSYWMELSVGNIFLFAKISQSSTRWGTKGWWWWPRKLSHSGDIQKAKTLIEN